MVLPEGLYDIKYEYQQQSASMGTALRYVGAPPSLCAPCRELTPPMPAPRWEGPGRGQNTPTYPLHIRYLVSGADLGSRAARSVLSPWPCSVTQHSNRRVLASPSPGLALPALNPAEVSSCASAEHRVVLG